MADVFISYAREDRDRVARLASALESAGLTVWWDRLIEPGSEFVRDTEKELSAADAVIVAWTKHSIASHWVRDEAGYGREKANLIPVLLDAVEPPLGFRQFQTADLSKWHGGQAPGIEEIVAKIRRPAGQPPALSPDIRFRRFFSLPARIAAAVTCILILGGAIVMFGSPERREPIPTERSAASVAAPAVQEVAPDPVSIAVLPFADLSPEGDQEYFSDGVAEEILHALARYPGLKVAGRTSSFKFKGVNEDLRVIGEQLNVAHVLEGSLRRQDDRVRITVQLIKTEDGFHLWSETFDRELTDIFAVQDEISRAVAQALAVRIGPASASGGTTNPAAYDVYLQGRQLLAKRGAENLTKSAELFAAAAALDPNFSAAHSGRARALSLIWDYAFVGNMKAGVEAAKEAADKALAANPDNAEAASVLGYLDHFFFWDWERAGKNVRRALALAPNDAEIANFAGDYFIYMMNYEEGFMQERRASELDPLHAVNYSDLAWRHYAVGQCDEGIEMAEAALAVDPAFMYAVFARARGEICLGRFDHARRSMATLTSAGQRFASLNIKASLALAERNDDGLRSALTEMEDGAPWGSAFYVAHFTSALGAYDEAAVWLERAYNERAAAFVHDYYRRLPEDWPDHPAIRAALDKPELNALYDIRRRNLAKWRAREQSP